MADSGVRFVELRISNFRALKEVFLDLEPLTILLGSNNAGKTSLLDAMNAALGVSRRALAQEDVFIATAETSAPKDRRIVIDILLRPVDDEGKLLDAFPAGSFWTELWGQGISQDEVQNDMVAIRTLGTWSESQGEYVTHRRFLKEWKPRSEWTQAQEKDAISALQLAPISLHYIDAKRDIQDDLRRQGSFWNRLTEDLGLGDADVELLEQALSKLNDDIVAKSDVLKHIRKNLLDIRSVVSAQNAGVDITPVARRLRDLSRGVDVTFSTHGAQAFPLARHGMGTRSLASLLVFRAFVSWRESKAKASNDRIHPLLALEEPESHLHPQAQRALFAQIRSIPGQRIVSTHSSYIAGQAKLEQLRLVRKHDDCSSVTALDLTPLKPSDRLMLERKVVATKGDLLFSRALVFYEGEETEDQAFPQWAQYCWGASIHELGLSFVSVEGCNYFPFVWLAKSFGIPWYILSDGESVPVTKLQASLTKAGLGAIATLGNVHVIPSNNCFEGQLLAEDYQPEIETAIAGTFGATYLDDYIKKVHGQKASATETHDFSGTGGRTRAVRLLIEGNKRAMALPIAEAVLASIPPKARLPTFVNGLFAKMSTDLGLTRMDGST
jgi:putative ATP-dependent endonuclease of OLD family